MFEFDVRHRQGSFTLEARFTAGKGITALFGRSGAGKSSVVNMIAGLTRPEHGRIVADGRVLFDSQQRIDVPVARRRVGYVFQEGRLFPHLTVRHNLLFGRWFTPKAERWADFDQVVGMLGIDHLLGRRPADLSGGEKQRVAIGRALLASPRLLLMDEPLAALDAQRKAEILPYLERLRDEAGVPVVYVSHAVEEVVRLADTLVVLADGHVAAAGPVGEVMSRLDVVALTGRSEAGAVLATIVEHVDQTYGITTLRFDGGALRVPFAGLEPGKPLRIHVHARDVALAVHRPEGVSFLNVLPARVLEIGAHDGAFAEVRVAVGASVLVSRITSRSLHELALSTGQDIFALVKSVALDPMERTAQPL